MSFKMAYYLLILKKKSFIQGNLKISSLRALKKTPITKLLLEELILEIPEKVSLNSKPYHLR